MTDLIARETRDGVMTVTINRPDKKNALNSAMYSALTAALSAAGGGEAAVVLLTGAGDAFTSGNDLNDFLSLPDAAAGDSPALTFLRTIAGFEKPVVAAVNGIAVGIGTTLLLHCDLVYASTDARFHLPFVDLAVVPEAASSLLLPRMAGHQKAAELILLGEPFGPETAREIGFVNDILAPGDVITHAHERAARLAAKPPQALRYAKRLLRMPQQALEERMDAENALFREQLASPEAREVMQAFLEKRRPDFSKIS